MQKPLGQLVSHTLKELKCAENEDRCVACGEFPAIAEVVPVSDEGALAGLDDYINPIALCPRCRGQHRKWLRIYHFGLYFGVPLPFFIGAASVAIFPVKLSLFPVLVFFAATFASLGVLKFIRRYGAVRLPLVVMSGWGQRVFFWAAPSSLSDEIPRGPYRSVQRAPATLGPAPPGLIITGGGWFYAFNVIIACLALAYVHPLCYPKVTLSNWSDHPCHVSIDGDEPFYLDALSSKVLRLRHGHYDFVIHDHLKNKNTSIDCELPWGSDHVHFISSHHGQGGYSDSRASRFRLLRPPYPNLSRASE